MGQPGPKVPSHGRVIPSDRPSAWVQGLWCAAGRSVMVETTERPQVEMGMWRCRVRKLPRRHLG
jgi:hypothetical protein